MRTLPTCTVSSGQAKMEIKLVYEPIGVPIFVSVALRLRLGFPVALPLPIPFRVTLVLLLALAKRELAKPVPSAAEKEVSRSRNFGDVINVELAMDRLVNLPRGYGYVEFKKRVDAEKALLYMDGVCSSFL
ncbi:hypothetical protein B296_00000611 [Ensete ventricosum]|uniref:RRM domain-containing protein n=1 Tax=Ensete ventricosum TaxID=4639 RepID=A0A427A8Z0_ENSVE|nr:hypothetical protein B296_00000611 [Ensete ventricosum]